MLASRGFGRPQAAAPDTPVELRFVDLLLIIIATVMFIAVLLSVVSALTGPRQASVVPLRITTVAVPVALADQGYNLTLAAVGGDGNLTWTRVAGTLPDGLVLARDGRVYGRPLNEGSTNAAVEVTDDQGHSYQKNLVFQVEPAAALVTHNSPLHVRSHIDSLPDATKGTSYVYRFTADSEQRLHRWMVTTGSLPAGLSLTSTGTLVGKPTETGTSNFTVTVTDSAGSSAKQDVRLTVADTAPPWWKTILTWLLTTFFYAALGATILFGGTTTGIIPWLRQKLASNGPEH